ncbi:MAG: hypothetical protein HUJ54_12120, partial [Erysipelotrichaceae bacterium]|nr:hypothetical protein [Erysipelotrichaceae bacterium]
MNKNAIQKYAVWARKELKRQIIQRAYQYGVTDDQKPELGLEIINGRMLTDTEIKQRNEFVKLVNRKGFDQAVEEVAYTWFNRLIALRFMEVNDYLPGYNRILSSPSNEFKPQILSNVFELNEKYFDRKKILKLKEEGKDEELYRYLLLAECNSLNEILPVMFEPMDDFAELLLPNNLLKPVSVIGKLVSEIDENDWKV